MQYRLGGLFHTQIKIFSKGNNGYQDCLILTKPLPKFVLTISTTDLYVLELAISTSHLEWLEKN